MRLRGLRLEISCHAEQHEITAGRPGSDDALIAYPARAWLGLGRRILRVRELGLVVRVGLLFGIGVCKHIDPGAIALVHHKLMSGQDGGDGWVR